ncbi:MAG: S53 family peptidase [Usitatibacter sp.]
MIALNALLLTLAAAVSASGPAPSAPLATKALTQGRVAWAVPENDVGEVDGDVQLAHLTVLLKRSPERQQAFEELLRQQQDPGSPNFHQWLSPVEVGERFGATPDRIEAVSTWLKSNGLGVDGVSNGRTRITFSGTAANVGAAFGSRMHAYAVKSEQKIAIVGTPRIPSDLAADVQAVVGLEAVDEKPQGHWGKAQVAAPPGGRPKSTFCSSGTCINYIWPSDFGVIYDIQPEYQVSINGAGQTVAILGRSNVYLPDIENFQTRSSLLAKDPITIVPPDGLDPGPPQSAPVTDTTTIAEQLEVTLDVTRVSGVAPAANIKLVISSNTKTSSGVGIAGQYVVDTNPVPAQIMSISFAACEQVAGQAAVQFWDDIFSQGAAEGISAFVGSGDSGAAGCDAHHTAPPPNQAASPNYICSSSYATCVGGTQFSDVGRAGSFWSSGNTSTFGSAKGYIPEGGWNEPTDDSGNLQVAASGGGFSIYIATPSWQMGPGVPGKQGRYTPDVSFSASDHDSYVQCMAAASGPCTIENGGSFHFLTGSGTSAAAPSMAGIAALLNQSMSRPQGNLNPTLYKIAATPGNGAFHDVTVATSAVDGCDVGTPSTCNNSTPGQAALQGGLAGYLVGPGYDLVTGLGSIDVANLFSQWSMASTQSTNYQGLWWAAPAGSESGWGINFAHQGDTIFATWFTYDTTGTGNWLVMTAPKTSGNTYSGTLYSTTGPAFNSVPFSPASVTAKAEGTGTLTFTDANGGTFSYMIGATTQTKTITREVFGTMPTCAPATGALTAATNYTDLWWASPAASESGWGINLTHEGTTIFGSWFTYDSTGKPMWLVVTAPQSAPNTYSGTLYRTTGPAFNSVPFNPANVAATSVGSATFTFANGNSAQFAYTVGSVSQTKTITREVFATTGTVCQ